MGTSIGLAYLPTIIIITVIIVFMITVIVICVRMARYAWTLCHLSHAVVQCYISGVNASVPNTLW